MDAGTPVGPDALLIELVRCPDPEERLSRLMTEEAEPVIRRVVISKMGALLHQNTGRDADDVASDAMARVVAQVRRFQTDPANHAISCFRGYCAATAYHCCCEFLRAKYPRRWSLKNKVRYVLRHTSALALWQSAEGEWIAGLAQWNPSPPQAPPSREPAIRSDDMAASVESALRAANHPIELDALVGWLASAMRIQDRPVQSISEFEVEDSHPSVATELEQRQDLARIWNEILDLPARQRSALLLNLRDSGGHGVIDLLISASIASFSQLAAALSMTLEELAGVWNDLPLDDARIGARLGVERQQVINLRKSARARLARRRIV